MKESVHNLVYVHRYLLLDKLLLFQIVSNSYKIYIALCFTRDSCCCYL